MKPHYLKDLMSPKPKQKELVWSDKHSGYILKEAYDVIEVKPINQYYYVHFLAEKYIEIFPHYNPEIHYVQLISDNLATGITVSLNKKREKNVNIPYGPYTLNCDSDYTTVLSPMRIETNKYIDIGQKTNAKLYEDFAAFKNNKALYEKENELHKRGAFLYGPPGCGKTREIVKLLEHAEQEQFYGFFISSSVPLDYLNDMKEFFIGQMSVVVLEEVTERIERHSIEELLSFLDGETSWNNCYVIATTNYPAKLELNMVDRPGRFNNIIEIGLPSKEQKTAYLKGKQVADTDIEYIIKEFPQASLDYLRELVIVHRTQNRAFSEIITSMLEIKRKIANEFRASLGLK